MPRSIGSAEKPQETKGIKKKITRERSRRNKTTRVNYGMYPMGKIGSKRRDIQYSNYAKALEEEGTLFSGVFQPENEIGGGSGGSRGKGKSRRRSNEGEEEEGRPKTRIVRFKKDAKVILERLLITWLRRISIECQRVCNLEGLSKIKERNVYTQIRLTYPPLEQEEVVDFCKKALRSYVASKVETNGNNKRVTIDNSNVSSPRSDVY